MKTTKFGSSGKRGCHCVRHLESRFEVIELIKNVVDSLSYSGCVD